MSARYAVPPLPFGATRVTSPDCSPLSNPCTYSSRPARSIGAGGGVAGRGSQAGWSSNAVLPSVTEIRPVPSALTTSTVRLLVEYAILALSGDQTGYSNDEP